MKKRFNKTLSLILSVVFVIGVFISVPYTESPFGVVADAASGSCGTGVSWKLDGEGTLTISGTGDMKDYSSYSSVPWYSYRYSILNVVIENGVTGIGDYAFKNCNAMLTVKIGEGLTDVGAYAFDGCNKMVGVYISDIVQWCSINFTDQYSNPLDKGKNLYLNDELLTNLVIPEGVTCISAYAFQRCFSIVSVTLPESLTEIQKFAFAYCNYLEAVYITDLTKWCRVSFTPNSSNPLNYAENLYLDGKLVTDLVIPDDVTSISNYAFYNCKSLTYLTIHENVTHIGVGSFGYCNNLQGVYINDLEKWCDISIGAQGTTSSLDNPLTYAGDLYLKGKLVTELVIPDGITAINAKAFRGCKSITSVTIPGSVTSIGISAFDLCTNLNEVHISDISKWCLVDVSPAANPLYCGGNLYVNGELVTELVIPDGTEEIKKYVFYNCKSIKSVVVPDSVKSVGLHAFTGCTNLEKAAISAMDTDVSSSGFVNCPNVTVYCFPNSSSHSYCESSSVKYILYQLTGVGETTVDTENKIIFTNAHGSDNLSDILTVSGYTTRTTASVSAGNLGTASSVDVFREGELDDQYKLIVIGDLNGDSVCDVLDAIEAERVSNGHQDATIEQVYAANGEVSDKIEVSSYQNVVNTVLAS